MPDNNAAEIPRRTDAAAQPSDKQLNQAGVDAFMEQKTGRPPQEAPSRGNDTITKNGFPSAADLLGGNGDFTNPAPQPENKDIGKITTETTGNTTIRIENKPDGALSTTVDSPDMKRTFVKLPDGQSNEFIQDKAGDITTSVLRNKDGQVTSFRTDRPDSSQELQKKGATTTFTETVQTPNGPLVRKEIDEPGLDSVTIAAGADVEKLKKIDSKLDIIGQNIGKDDTPENRKLLDDAAAKNLVGDAIFAMGHGPDADLGNFEKAAQVVFKQQGDAGLDKMAADIDRVAKLNFGPTAGFSLNKSSLPKIREFQLTFPQRRISGDISIDK
ncbi:MAG: hypothetical protein JST01_14990 [Cyanobacteria bacterium SZAS TMP-1]|nr:hypothetical protein [Cyanobacteria bacterium SZAS TMP-1]